MVIEQSFAYSSHHAHGGPDTPDGMGLSPSGFPLLHSLSRNGHSPYPFMPIYLIKDFKYIYIRIETYRW